MTGVNFVRYALRWQITNVLPVSTLTLLQNLNEESQHGTVGVRLKDTNFDAVTRIQANKEGEALYVLQPKTMKVAHRLICEVKLREDKVKHITFRSALLVENNTQIPIDMLVGDDVVANAKIMTIGTNILHSWFAGQRILT
jgi:hypothetical protein